jgi:hypothetical protein
MRFTFITHRKLAALDAHHIRRQRADARARVAHDCQHPPTLDASRSPNRTGRLGFQDAPRLLHDLLRERPLPLESFQFRKRIGGQTKRDGTFSRTRRCKNLRVKSDIRLKFS